MPLRQIALGCLSVFVWLFDPNHPSSLVISITPSRRGSEIGISVNPSVPVNRESPRDFAILDGVGTRKRAILDADLAGRDEQLGAAVYEKPQKTRDLNEKSRDSRLGFLCLPDWLSFEPILKGSPSATLFVTILSALEVRKAFP